MSIIQQNPEKPNTVITINPMLPSEIVVAPFIFSLSQSAGGSVDVTNFQGGPFRLYVSEKGELTTDLINNHFWLLAEAVIPDRQYDNIPTGQVGEQGEEITEIVEQPLNLNTIEITVFPLPEVK